MDPPNQHAFDAHMGLLISQTLAGRHVTVRLYGEIVDIVWKAGRAESALALALLWNKLVARRGCALICGYSMGHFYRRTEQMQRICDQHTHVLSSDARIVPFNSTRARTA
jgi:hypothetical protein